jgi:polygalacturonase
MRIDVTKHGLTPNTGKLLTKEFQKLIDNSPKNAVFYFPSGEYMFSTIHLRSDMTIEISRFAKILGSSNFYDYERHEKIDYPIYQDASHTYFNTSLFLGINCENIKIIGNGTIDMQSIWDEDNIRDIVHRGAKCIALKECSNIVIEGITVLNSTDLAIYFAGCNYVHINKCKLEVYIDGISPDNSKNVLIENCDILAGDDSIVFKSSYTLNRLDICDNIEVRNCNLSSRCNAIKFGTESNGGFRNIHIHDVNIKNIRIAGLAIESVDGGIVDNVIVNDVVMKNVNCPFFIHLGKRMRGPKELTIGQIKNIKLKNIKVIGPYRNYKSIPWNYISYKANDYYQNLHHFGEADHFNQKGYSKDWQFTSNICGLKGHELENISLENIDMTLYGGVREYQKHVPENPISDYPEAYVYGKILPSSGLYFRYIKNLKLTNVKIKTTYKDNRQLILKEFVN